MEKFSAKSLVVTNAFLFDDYNRDLCCSQHLSSIQSLVFDITSEAIGIKRENWNMLDSIDEKQLPVSFSGRTYNRKRQKNNLETNNNLKKHRRQHEYANRRRVCICVPIGIGKEWWLPGVSPCGRRGQQCGCKRDIQLGIGSVWEVWRNEEWNAAIIISELEPFESSNTNNNEKSSRSNNNNATTASTTTTHTISDIDKTSIGLNQCFVNVAFLSDGFMDSVSYSCIRPPSKHISIDLLNEFNVSTCVCSNLTHLNSNDINDNGKMVNINAAAADDGFIQQSIKVQPLRNVNEKHWEQRYRYFSKFDQGIQIDFEGLYSITPEVIANHVAKRVSTSNMHGLMTNINNKKKNHVIFDAFCGCGGNAIAFARHIGEGGIVISVDIDPIKIKCAKNNAKLYGLENKIEFIVGDSSEMLLKLFEEKKKNKSKVNMMMKNKMSCADIDNSNNNTSVKSCHNNTSINNSNRRDNLNNSSLLSCIDVICLAPPWGGPDYLSEPIFDLNKLCCPINGQQWLKLALKITPNVVMLIPRTVEVKQLYDIRFNNQESLPSNDDDDDGCSIRDVEVEDAAINYKVKLKVAYYGQQLVRQNTQGVDC